jgi:hypothetical protein
MEVDWYYHIQWPGSSQREGRRQASGYHPAWNIYSKANFKVRSGQIPMYEHSWAFSAEERKSTSPQVFFCCAAMQT